MPLSRIDLTERFKKDFSKLPREVAERVKSIIKDELMPWPTRKVLRHHTLSGYSPTIHKLDVVQNKAYQLSFEIEGDTAKLLRVTTHKEMDRSPR